MNYNKMVRYFFIFCLCAMLLISSVSAFEKSLDPDKWIIQGSEMGKELFDDPVDLFVTRPFKSFLPPEVWERLTFDQEKMKKGTAELLGFTAPELVGKIAPEIKPGKYTYKDLENNPGLKELFPPLFAEHVIKPGGPPLIGNIPEFEIIPTRQFHYNIPLLEATKRNLGKAKLDKDGYILARSWCSGVPFPRPSGEHKAQQVFYNFEKRAMSIDECWGFAGIVNGFNKKLELDFYTKHRVAKMRWKGRTLFKPYGWFDERAERNNEMVSYSYSLLDPRSMRGTIVMRFLYDDPEKPDPMMVYVPSLRRIRKLSATDTQDPTGDITYDDQNIFLGKVSPNKYPYHFDIIEEREYLQCYNYGNNPSWCDSKDGYAMRDVTMMRRPVYVLQMRQLDPNYVYSKRIIYIDKESFDCVYGEYIDQKGCLYRSQYYVSNTFMPEWGLIPSYGLCAFQRDHIDQHSSVGNISSIPAPWFRSRFSIQEMIKRGK